MSNQEGCNVHPLVAGELADDSPLLSLLEVHLGNDLTRPQTKEGRAGLLAGVVVQNALTIEEHAAAGASGDECKGVGSGAASDEGARHSNRQVVGSNSRGCF